MAVSRVASRQRILGGIGTEAEVATGEEEEAVTAVVAAAAPSTHNGGDGLGDLSGNGGTGNSGGGGGSDSGGDGGGSDRSSSCGCGSGNPPNDLCRPISPSPYLLAVAALRPARGVGRNDDEAEEKKLHLLLVLYLCSVRVFAQRGGRRGMVSGTVTLDFIREFCRIGVGEKEEKDVCASNVCPPDQEQMEALRRMLKQQRDRGCKRSSCVRPSCLGQKAPHFNLVFLKKISIIFAQKEQTVS